MAANYLVQAFFQDCRVNGRAEAYRQREVVEGAAGLKLVEEPEALLRVGEVTVSLFARNRQEGQTQLAVPRALHRLDARGETRDGRNLEESPQRQLYAKRFADPWKDFGDD